MRCLLTTSFWEEIWPTSGQRQLICSKQMRWITWNTRPIRLALRINNT